jgi:DNA-binding NtrC family response regulator
MNQQKAPCILLVEPDIIVRNSLAEYLRACGYRVLEAANTAEAREVIGAADDISLVLADAAAPEDGGFALRAWIHETDPKIDVILAGSIPRAVEKSSDICKDGPAVTKPYHHQLVLDTIKRLSAARDRNKL